MAKKKSLRNAPQYHQLTQLWLDLNQIYDGVSALEIFDNFLRNRANTAEDKSIRPVQGATSDSLVGGAFVWQDSPEGNAYWADVHQELCDLQGKEGFVKGAERFLNEK